MQPNLRKSRNNDATVRYNCVDNNQPSKKNKSDPTNRRAQQKYWWLHCAHLRQTVDRTFVLNDLFYPLLCEVCSESYRGANSARICTICSRLFYWNVFSLRLQFLLPLNLVNWIWSMGIAREQSSAISANLKPITLIRIPNSAETVHWSMSDTTRRALLYCWRVLTE